jgi:hypothetical protein
MPGLRYAYDSTATTMTRPNACQLSVALREGYKFTGKEQDTESGLDNFGKRYHALSRRQTRLKILRQITMKITPMFV